MAQTNGGVGSSPITFMTVGSGRIIAVGMTFEDLFALVQSRAQLRPEGSGTVRELDAGVHEIGKKIVEEAAEVWMAAEYQSKDEAAAEISQLLYHTQVMMVALGLDLDDVYAHL